MPAPTSCPDCGGTVDVTGAAVQYQEDLPPVRPVVRRFDIEVGHCSQCRRRIQGRHPLQTSDALGAARVQLGPGVVALVVDLHTRCGLPLAKVADLLQTRFGLQVTPGGLVHLLHRAARDARPAYEDLREQVRNAPVVTVDETGWRVDGVGHWLWAGVTPTTTVYAICAGRGFDDAQAVLGADFKGVLVRDGWVVYRSYINGEHQSCVRHLLRRCAHLLEDHPHCGWAGQVQDTLQAALALRDRRNAGSLSDHGLSTGLRGHDTSLVLIVEPGRRHRIDPRLVARTLNLTPSESQAGGLAGGRQERARHRRGDEAHERHRLLAPEADLQEAGDFAAGGPGSAGAVARGTRVRARRPLAAARPCTCVGRTLEPCRTGRRPDERRWRERNSRRAAPGQSPNRSVASSVCIRKSAAVSLMGTPISRRPPSRP